MAIIDLPQDLLKAVKVTWTMRTNHARLESPFTGVGQTQRGQLERFDVALDFQGVERKNAGDIEGFFLQIEANANPFRMHDPARPNPAGVVYGSPTLGENALAGDREITIAGLPASHLNVFKAGDWIQIGYQLTKITTSVDSLADGTANARVWPKLWAAQTAGAPIIYKEPKGLFRFLSEPPEWEVMAGASRPWSFKLTGTQEVVADGHSLLTS